MMGGMFAGTEEAPGEVILYQGRSYKSYRGMGSIGAMQQGSADRYFQESSTGNPNADKLVPEGIEGRVPYKGSMVSIVYQMAGGVRASMGYCGCATISEMNEKAEFVEITAAGIRESTCTTCRSPRKRPTTALTKQALKSDQIEKSGQNAKIWPELLVLARFFVFRHAIYRYLRSQKPLFRPGRNGRARRGSSHHAPRQRSRAHAAHAPQARDHR
jgi:hypothetical protein